MLRVYEKMLIKVGFENALSICLKQALKVNHYLGNKSYVSIWNYIRVVEGVMI